MCTLALDRARGPVRHGTARYSISRSVPSYCTRSASERAGHRLVQSRLRGEPGALESPCQPRSSKIETGMHSLPPDFPCARPSRFPSLPLRPTNLQLLTLLPSPLCGLDEVRPSPPHLGPPSLRLQVGDREERGVFEVVGDRLLQSGLEVGRKGWFRVCRRMRWWVTLMEAC